MSEPPAVPRKSAQVVEYERSAEAGGWHDEVGFLVLAAGGIGWVWLYSRDLTVAPGAFLFALTLIAAIFIWRQGHRQGKHKDFLRQEALHYVQQIQAAQQAGLETPALSAPLEALADDESA